MIDYLQCATSYRFDLYFRKNPFGGEYTVFAGLEECIRFIANFKLSKEEIAFVRESLSPTCEVSFGSHELKVVQLQYLIDIKKNIIKSDEFFIDINYPVVDVRMPSLITLKELTVQMLKCMQFQKGQLCFLKYP